MTTLSHVSAASTLPASRLARHATTAARILLGLVFFVFGLIGLLDLIPPPESGVPAAAMALSTALLQSGYMFPLIKGTEVVGGALLLSNRFVPLALVLLAPVVVNILLFHLFLTPGDVLIATLVLALELGLAWAHRAAYRPLLAARTTQ